MTLDTEDLLAAQLHELKNSLGLLAINLERIPRQGAPEHDAPLDAVRLLCGQIGDRLHQTLLLYRMKNRGVSVNLDAHSPADLIDELAASAESLAAGRFAVERGIADAVPAIWFFDRNLVEMAMINAIHNSLAYARERIVIRAEVEGGYLTLTVRDDSAGYPEHILVSSEQGTPCRGQGTGLGLGFAAMIAQAHVNQERRGRLRLYNQDGACFSLYLP